MSFICQNDEISFASIRSTLGDVKNIIALNDLEIYRTKYYVNSNGS